MNFRNNLQRLLTGTLVALFLLSFASCSKDDVKDIDSNNPTDQFNPYVLSLAVQGSDGNFTYYTVPYNDIMSGTLSAEGRGIEQPGYYDFTQIGNTIYSIGGLDDVDMIGIKKDTASDKLKKFGHIAFDVSVSDLKKVDKNTLVSVSMRSSSDIITFRKIEANSITVTAEKNISEDSLFNRLKAKEGVNYSGMAISGNHLFLSYYISNSETFATPYTDTARVAVFSFPELEFQKIIKDTRVGPIGGFNIKGGLIKDENGNVYAVSHSNPANGYSQSTQPSGILKIKNGDTDFDPNYFFDISAKAEGGNTAHLLYLGNGRAFAEINTATRDNQEEWSDSPLRSAIIDLNNKEVHFIDGILEHKGNGRRLSALIEDDNIYLPMASDNGIYIYKINTNDYTATQGAAVQANFVAGIFKL